MGKFCFLIINPHHGERVNMKKHSSFIRALDEARRKCSYWQEIDETEVLDYKAMKQVSDRADGFLKLDKNNCFVVEEDGSIGIYNKKSDEKTVIFQARIQKDEMYCPYCGKPVSKEARFCSHCGNEIKEILVKTAEQKPEKKVITKKEKPKKKKKGILGKLIITALVIGIILETCNLLFIDPGYKELRNLLLSFTDGKEVDESQFSEEALLPTEEIKIVFSDSEVKSVKEERKPVTKDNTVADFGDVSVDMTEYNILTENEEVIVRHLGKKEDETSGWKIDGYDFSLASGLREFFTHARITFPVEESDDLFTCFAYYNEKSKQWEDLPFKLSEDGKQYYVYINHFTKVGKVKRRFNLKEELKRSKTDVERLLDSSSVTIDMFVEYKNSLDSNHMMWPVHLDTSLLIEKAEKGQLQAVEAIVKKLSDSSVETDKILKQFDNPAFALFSEASGYSQAALGLNELSEAIKDFKPFDLLGKVLATADLFLALNNLKNEVLLNRDIRAKELWQKRWGDLITVGAYYTAFLTLKGAVKTQFGLLSLAWWFGTYCYDNFEKIDSYNLDLKDPEWRFYEFYLATDRNINFTLKHPFATSLDGLMKKPPSMDDKDFKVFQTDMAKVAGLNGNAKTWVPAFSSIMKIYKDRPEMIPTIIDELYEKYARSYFDLTEKERSTWQKEANKKLAIDMSKYQHLSYSDTKEEVDKMKMKMRALTAQALLEAYGDASLDVTALIRKFARENIDKIINSEVEFRVVDESLEKGKSFAESRYYVDYRELAENADYIKKKQYDKVVSPMRFAGVDKPGFIPQQPGGKKGSRKYYYPYKDNFLPTVGNDNVVFRSTLFHWIMMGSPYQMNFTDLNSANKTTLLASAAGNIRASGNKTVFTVSVNPGLSIDDYLGLWRESKGRGYIGLAYDNGKLGYYEGEKIDYNKDWVVIDSYEIDPKTKTLTLYSKEFVGPAKLTLVKAGEISMVDQQYGGTMTLIRIDE